MFFFKEQICIEIQPNAKHYARNHVQKKAVSERLNICIRILQNSQRIYNGGIKVDESLLTKTILFSE